MAVETILKEKNLSLEFICRTSIHPLDDYFYRVIAYREMDNTYIVYDFNSSCMDITHSTYLSPTQD